ncbi:mobile mystery protein A [bacterium]|nr:mobile mystery protein A [bacterium]
MNSRKARALRRKQLDKALSSNPRVADLPRLKNGYIRELRTALGISSTRLGKMMNVSQPALTKLESNEREGVITLNSLQKAANALGCDLVYALIPKTSLETHLRINAREAAQELINEVNHSMILESQGASKEYLQEEIDEIADSLVANLDKRIWDLREN